MDKSFLIYLNSGSRPVHLELPENDWVQAGEVVLSTDFKLPVGTPVKAGDRLSLGSRSVLVLRADLTRQLRLAEISLTPSLLVDQK